VGEVVGVDEGFLTLSNVTVQKKRSLFPQGMGGILSTWTKLPLFISMKSGRKLMKWQKKHGLRGTFLADPGQKAKISAPLVGKA